MSKQVNQDELMALIDEQQNREQKETKKKGPKTVVVDEPLIMSGDPLGLSQSEKISPELEPQTRIKKKDDIVVERYNPEIEKGLNSDDVEQRKLAGMVNVANTGSTKTIKKILFSNIVTFFNILTFAIAGWLWSIGQYTQTFFALIVSMNTLIGIIQEIRAKKMVDKLSLLSAPTANTIRDGLEQEISIHEVVIDDILYLSSGKQIIVDAVIRQGVIEVNESLLTGESDPIIKKKGDTLYSGSYVISGNAYVQATAIGTDIYVQKLTNQAKVYRKPKSDLLKSLKTVIRTVGVVIIPIGALLFWMNAFESSAVFNPERYSAAVVATAGAMIGMVPSGLFLLTSVALAVSMVRLAQNNTLVQELYCIEMLARVDTLCLDKTGTITDGTMTVKSVIEYDSVPGLTLKNLMSAILNAQDDQNLTSSALLDRFGNNKRIRHKALIPFSSSRKYSAVEFDKFGTFALGAPEFIFKKDYQKIAAEVQKQAEFGYRVLALVHASESIDTDKMTLEGTLKVIALIMIEDTIRPDAIDTINYFKKNGVDVKVISGDNPLTVSRISARAGIENAEQYISLDGLSDKEVVRVADKYQVFGRVSPHQKKLLVESLKNNGRTVAMTGDGVNDILALKEADTSIAMASGSEAARNVSHLVLLDSNFGSMPKVVAEGRRVINNIERVSSLFLTKTVFTFFLAIMALFRQGKYPISPIQLNLIEFLVIAIPSFVLALEGNNKRVEGNFLINVIKQSLPGALVVLINSLIVFLMADVLGYAQDEKVISTIIVLSATFTLFMVLLKISLPFNNRRLILFISMLSLAVGIVLINPHMFNFSPFYASDDFKDAIPLTVPQILLLIVLIQSSYPLIYVLSNIYRWVVNLVKKMMDKIADTQ